MKCITKMANEYLKNKRTTPMTAEQLEEQTQAICASLGPVHGLLLTDGYEASAEAVMEAGVLLQALARRVLAAEKLVEALEQCRDELMSACHSEFDGVWLESDFKEVSGKYDAALTAYREASK